MSNVTFQYDTVLSDVHVLTRRGRRLATRVNTAGQPVFVSRFRIFSDLEDDDGGEQESAGDAPEGRAEPLLDEDGDIDVTRRRKTNVQRAVTCPVILQQSNPEAEVYDDDDDTEEKRCRDVLRIEHTMATPLDDVGKQVWRGALLLADYFLWQRRHLAGRTVLELGAGTGLTSLVMAATAATVYCTDLGQDLLTMCRRNVAANSHVTRGQVKVRHLDWLQEELPLQEEDEEEGVAEEEEEEKGKGFGWTQQEVAHLHAEGSIIVAADVCYDDQLTDGLFRTVLRLCRLRRHTFIYFAIERRYNFTLQHLRVSCDAYDHFRRHLEQLRVLKDSACHFQVQMLPCDFPQALEYERVEQLELWKVTCSTDILEPPENREPLENQEVLEIQDVPEVPEPPEPSTMTPLS